MNKIIYIADPMCSWCYGFSTELEQFRASVKDKLKFELVVGGLRAGDEAATLDSEFVEVLRHHWNKVADTTGQKVNMAFLDTAEGYHYDTEPACRAVTLMGEAAPEQQFEYLASVQKAFYQDNKDISSADILAELGQSQIDKEMFLELFASDAIKDMTQQDFELSRQWQVMSYPTLLYATGDRLILLSQGYAKFDDLTQGLAQIENDLTSD